VPVDDICRPVSVPDGTGTVPWSLVSPSDLGPSTVHGHRTSTHHVLAEAPAVASTTPLFDEEFIWTLAIEEFVIIYNCVFVILEVTICVVVLAEVE